MHLAADGEPAAVTASSDTPPETIAGPADPAPQDFESASRVEIEERPELRGDKGGARRSAAIDVAVRPRDPLLANRGSPGQSRSRTRSRVLTGTPRRSYGARRWSPKLASMEQAPAPAFGEGGAPDCPLTMLERPRSPTVAEMATRRALKVSAKRPVGESKQGAGRYRGGSRVYTPPSETRSFAPTVTIAGAPAEPRASPLARSGCEVGYGTRPGFGRQRVSSSRPK